MTVTLHNISHRYGPVHALENVALELADGVIHGLVGMNGSGKSTLFNVIAGVITPTSGTVTVDGEGTATVAYVPQSDAVDWTFPVSVRDVVMLGRYGHMGLLKRPRPADRAAVDEALERTQLADLADRQIGQLSGGQKKRTFVARGLAQDADTILLDEPFAGVDTVSQTTITGLLRSLADDGRCVLLSTHDLASVPEVCDTVTMLQRRVIAHGPPSEVMTTGNLLATFSTPSDEGPDGTTAVGTDTGADTGAAV